MKKIKKNKRDKACGKQLEKKSFLPGENFTFIVMSGDELRLREEKKRLKIFNKLGD